MCGRFLLHKMESLSCTDKPARPGNLQVPFPLENNPCLSMVIFLLQDSKSLEPEGLRRMCQLDLEVNPCAASCPAMLSNELLICSTQLQQRHAETNLAGR